jgi:hypothetical protein
MSTHDIVLDQFSQPRFSFLARQARGLAGTLCMFGIPGAALLLTGLGENAQLSLDYPLLAGAISVLGGVLLGAVVLGIFVLIIAGPFISMEQAARAYAFTGNPLSPELMGTRIGFIDQPFEQVVAFIGALQRRTEALGPPPEFCVGAQSLSLQPVSACSRCLGLTGC